MEASRWYGVGVHVFTDLLATLEGDMSGSLFFLSSRKRPGTTHFTTVGWLGHQTWTMTFTTTIWWTNQSATQTAQSWWLLNPSLPRLNISTEKEKFYPSKRTKRQTLMSPLVLSQYTLSNYMGFCVLNLTRNRSLNRKEIFFFSLGLLMTIMKTFCWNIDSIFLCLPASFYVLKTC